MTKAELIAKVAADAGIEKKNADKAVNAALEAITAALVNGEKVSLIGFGTFEVRERAARSSTLFTSSFSFFSCAGPPRSPSANNPQKWRTY